MKQVLFTFYILIFSLLQLQAQENKNQNTPQMNRIERTEKTFKALFGREISTHETDPELMTILQRFIFGEVFYAGSLDYQTRELITITTLAVNQALPLLKAHTEAALSIGVKPLQIRESIYQLAPFIGFPKVLNALETINSVFKSKGIKLPLEKTGTVQEEERLQKGKEQQEPLYGNGMKEAMKDMPGIFDTFIPDMLTTSLFADFYTRGGLDLQTRELLIFCALATLGGTERQMASHAVGNLKVGNTKEILVAAMVQCYPYIGFPRISNAINVLKDAKLE